MNTQKLRELAKIVNAQAEDDGLWFIAETAPEAYLQQELRELHSAVEAACPANILALIDSHAELLDSRDALLAAIEDVIGFIPEHRQRALRSAITKAEAL